MENPWRVDSIYELQYFNCPTCNFKDHTKQAFVNHTYDIHPSSIEYLKNIGDQSLNDVILPWNEQILDIKTDYILNTEQIEEFYHSEDPLNIGIKAEENIYNGVDEDDTNLICEMNTCKNSTAIEIPIDENNKPNQTNFKEDSITEQNNECPTEYGSGKKEFVSEVNIETIQESQEQYLLNPCYVDLGQKVDQNPHFEVSAIEKGANILDAKLVKYNVHDSLKRGRNLILKSNHKCETCGKYFSKNRTLIDHINIVHEGRNMWEGIWINLGFKKAH